MKKNLWRLLALALCLCLTMAMLTGCGEEEEPVYDEPVVEEPTGEITPQGMEDQLFGTWILEDGTRSICFDGEGVVTYQEEGLTSQSEYTYDGETIIFEVLYGGGHSEVYFAFLEPDNSLPLDDLGGVYWPEGSVPVIDEPLVAEGLYDLYDTWHWKDGDSEGRFTFSEDWVEFGYSSPGDMGAGSGFYTLTEDGVDLSELQVDGFGDGLFVFRDENTLVASNGAILYRGEAPAQEDVLEIVNTVWSVDGVIYYFMEDGEVTAEAEGYDPASGTYYWDASSGTGELILQSVTAALRAQDGGLVMEGEDGNLYPLQYLTMLAPDEGGEALSLSPGGWEDALEGMWLYGENDVTYFCFDGAGIVDLGNTTDPDFFTRYCYAYDGQQITFLSMDTGEISYGYLDADGDLWMDGLDNYFYRMEQTEGAPNLDGTYWDNDHIGMSLIFEDGLFALGSDSDGVTTGNYVFEGVGLDLYADNGTSAEGILDPENDIVLVDIRGWFYQVEEPGYLDY